MTPPTWTESGEPVNLEAAATDAHQWLYAMARFMDNGVLKLAKHAENRKRIGMAIEYLEKFLEEKKE